MKEDAGLIEKVAFLRRIKIRLIVVGVMQRAQ